MHHETYLNLLSDCHGDLGSFDGSQNIMSVENIMMTVFKSIFCTVKNQTIDETMEQILSKRTQMYNKSYHNVFNKLEISRLSVWSVGQK